MLAASILMMLWSAGRVLYLGILAAFSKVAMSGRFGSSKIPASTETVECDLFTHQEFATRRAGSLKSQQIQL